jgi:hypothetical protein
MVKSKDARSIRGLQAKGKIGRVNVSEPLLMPRQREHPDGLFQGCSGLVRCEAAGGGRETYARSWSTAVPGYRGHPIRLGLDRVERGNPDGVRAEAR